MSGRTLYHLTLAENLPAIMREGLRPLIGERAALISEPDPAIYFFRSLDDLLTGFNSWLAEEYEDNGDLALLRVELPAELEPFATDVGFETQVRTVVPVSAISVVDERYDP